MPNRTLRRAAGGGRFLLDGGIKVLVENYGCLKGGDDSKGKKSEQHQVFARFLQNERLWTEEPMPDRTKLGRERDEFRPGNEILI